MYIFPASHGIYGLFHARDIYSLLGKEYIKLFHARCIYSLLCKEYMKSLAIFKNTVVYILCYSRNIWKLHVENYFPDSNCQYTALNFLN